MFSVLDFLDRIEDEDDGKWVTVNDQNGRELWTSAYGDEILAELVNLEVKDFNVKPDCVNLFVEL